MTQACQVDFYVLARPTQSPGQFVCRLAMMAWEQGHRILVRTENQEEASRLDELMWDYPPGRFLPHGLGGREAAPVAITTRDEAIPEHRNLVINLCTQPVPEPEHLARLCEIVPAEPSQRTASREKFRAYRARGLAPETHDIG